ncbi:MAG: DUF2262 domain-containing protein [Lachnospiraceae bacterium]|jgi:hypothetical protein|nr:DUF2262 domain-containing protein [Lachnospiraceae bacterium]
MNIKEQVAAFDRRYELRQKEILALIHGMDRAYKVGDFWHTSKNILAYIDLDSKELIKAEGRLSWLIAEKKRQKHGSAYPYFFKNDYIYRLRVRPLAYSAVSADELPYVYNSFIVVKVIRKNVSNDALNEVLKEYLKPVILTDDILGEFKLNKDYGWFEGDFQWLGEKVSVSFDYVDIVDRETWTQALGALRVLYNEQTQRDAEFREFAARALTETANEWADEGAAQITREDFTKKIGLSEINVNPEGDFTAYYDDGDLFYGHIIEIKGNVEDGLKEANISG